MNKLLIVVLIFIFCACGQEQVEAPFERNRMQSILLDLHILEAQVDQTKRAARDSVKEAYLNEFFDLYGIDSNDLYQIQKYLEANPKQTDTIYDEIKSEINRLNKQ